MTNGWSGIVEEWDNWQLIQLVTGQFFWHHPLGFVSHFYGSKPEAVVAWLSGHARFSWIERFGSDPIRLDKQAS